MRTSATIDGVTTTVKLFVSLATVAGALAIAAYALLNPYL